ncbi:MAG: hypothetical protein QG637_1043 [Chloroflexota bacterium]|nr:hypothetical protein [Chloroflexota bacterium]
MDVVSAFLTRNIVYVYFFYGLAFFSLGLVVLLESGRASEFRFARALLPLALFGFAHGAHEWFEMFQIFAAHATGHTAGLAEEVFRVVSLTVSFCFLLAFGARLLPDAEARPRASYGQVAAMIGVWLAATLFVYLRQRPTPDDLALAADVLSRYILGITGALLASWALLRERRDFHQRGMSHYGQALLWAALAFFVYGVIGQLFVRPSIVAPSQIVNTALFVRLFGFPVQLLRGAAAAAIAITLGSALRAFEAEGRLRLARANKARLEAQAAALEAQAQRTQEVEALNVQLRGTTRELSALVEMSRTLSSTIELDRVLHYALYQIANSFEAVGCAAIFLKQSGMAEPIQTYYHPPAAGLDQPPAAPLLSAVASRTTDSGQAAGVDPAGEIVIVEDLDADGNLAAREPSGPYRTLGAPLIARGEPVGSLVMASAQVGKPFTGQDLNLLAAFARQITTSIENARLYQVLQEREARLAELFRQLVNAQEGERQRIARELHDETGQKLTALAMGLAAVEASGLNRMTNDAGAEGRSLIHNLRGVTDQAITELRHIMSDLRPALLDDLGLAPALRSYVQQYALRHPEISVTLSADRPARRLPSQYETTLFRVAQEALTNIARHAQATHATVIFEQRPDGVRLEINDDGVGFSPDAERVGPHAPGSGLGLVGMRERVTLVGGRWSVQSAPGQGTRVVVELPLA